MDQTDIELLVSEIVTAAGEPVTAAYLFGSVARGTATRKSDVDVAILFRKPPAGRLDDLRFTLEGELERAIGRQVQVVALNTAPPDLVHRVLRDGHLLLDRDPAARIRFEVQARNLYFDLLPVLRRYRRQEVATP